MSKNRILPDWIDFYHSVPRPSCVVSPAELDLGLYDWLLDKPDVSSLICDLGLVPGPVPSSFNVACKTPLFCEVVKAALRRTSSEHYQLCYELYLRNRKRSRYVHFSYTGKKV